MPVFPTTLTWSVALLAAILCAPELTPSSREPQAPSPKASQPVFRAGIELLTLDVTALNDNGRQVTDLAAADFVVQIDGDVRQVASAEYVRLVDPLRIIGAPRPVAAPVDETFFSSNSKGAPPGRLIVLLIDQGNIRTGAARPAMMSAKKFVDTLTPEDRVAVVAVPGPGELVDFTTDHDKVREALLRIPGTANALRVRFNLSITESFAVHLRTDGQLAAEVIARECGQSSTASDSDRCEREVEQDAAEVVSEVRNRTNDSIRGMRELLKSLAAIEGPKAVILVSEGLILDGSTSDVDDLASIAADSRASLDVLLLDVPRFDASQDRKPTTPREDRDLQITGLDSLAGAARGTLFRVNTSADYAFDRISRALDGYYLLGVESRPNDRDGKRHKLSVKVGRRGVSVRSRRTFLTSVSAKASTPADAVSRALRSPLTVNDLPLRMSTWVFKEPGSRRVRVLVAAEVERFVDQSLEYTTGLLLVTRDRRGLAPAIDLKTLTVKAGDPGTAVYSGAITVDPGTYRLHLSLADSEGRVGSIDRIVEAWQMDGPALALGDLLVSGIAASGRAPLSPAIEPFVSSGQMAALVEVYGAASATLAGVEAVFEVLQDERSQPIATAPMQIGAGSSPEIATAYAQIGTSALPPGRYLARTTIRQGGKAQGHMVRPFRIVAAAAESTTGANMGAVGGGALPGDMAAVLVGALPKFDRRQLLSPAMLMPVFALAEKRAGGSAAALKEARGGDLGSAAMTALGDGDQALASFLKGLDLLSRAQIDRAAIQFQSTMETAPTFLPARLYLGAAMAEGNRHKEAAGLIQSASGAGVPAATTGRIAGEEWMKAGQPALAIGPLEEALKQSDTDPQTRKLLGVAYVLGNRPAEAVSVLMPYLDAHPTDRAALLAAIYGTYMRHLTEPQRNTLAADRDRAARWSTAYTASGGPMQPLVGAWMKYLQGIK